MTDLTYRAEQAVLGALIAGGADNREPDGIEAGDFGDPRHRAIFAVLTDAVPQPGGWLGKLRMWLAGLPFRGQVRGFRDYLAELPGTCPDPRHLSSYAEMVAESSDQRRLAAPAGAARAEQVTPHLGRLAGAAAYLAGEGQRTAGNPRWPSRSVRPGLDAALARDAAPAARAVQQHKARQAAHSARAFAAHAGPAASRSRQAQEPPAREARVGREDLEELVLAGLMQRPGDAEEILSWLPARVFTSDARRVMYGAVRHRLQDGEPADPLIVAWEMNRARELRRADSSQDSEAGHALDPGYVLRVGAIDVAPGTAALLARTLLADHVCTQRFGADWPHSGQLTQAASSLAPQPGKTAVPAAQPQPATSPDPHPEDPPGPAEEPAPATRPAIPAAANGAGATAGHDTASRQQAAAEDAAAMPPPPAIPAPAGPAQRM